MKCEHVQAALVFLLDGELTAADRTMIQEHLDRCDVCRAELGRLTGQALQSLAAPAEPSPQAWSRLQAQLAQTRLTKEAQPSSGRLSMWLSRLAPSRGSTPTHSLGDKTMRKRNVVLPALVAVVVIALVAVFAAQKVTPVSAKQILDRAYAVQSATKPSQGIYHFRVESYDNLQALEGNSAGIKTIVDTYLDLQTGNLRNITTNADSGKVLDAFAYDGSNTYSTKGEPLNITSTGTLTIYRSPQSQTKRANPGGGATMGFEQMFAEIRANPQVVFEGKETWSDGRSIYVLSSQQPAKLLNDPNSLQTTRMFFDANTYWLLEQQVTFQKNGKEVLVADVRYLVNETLPANSPVAWDLSDLQGVNIVDDVDRTQDELLPEKITVQELVAHTRTGYILKTVPAGFNLEIEAPPKQDKETAYVYSVSYRKPDDYFAIVVDGAPVVPAPDVDETYTTTSGLVVSFQPATKGSGTNTAGTVYQFATVKAPDGTAFRISSTLPRERVKALAEDLVVAK